MFQFVISILLTDFNLLDEIVTLENSSNRLYLHHIFIHHLMMRDFIIRHDISHIHNAVFIPISHSLLTGQHYRQRRCAELNDQMGLCKVACLTLISLQLDSKFCNHPESPKHMSAAVFH